MPDPKSFQLSLNLTEWYNKQDASSVTYGDLINYIADELSAHMSVRVEGVTTNDCRIVLPDADNQPAPQHSQFGIRFSQVSSSDVINATKNLAVYIDTLSSIRPVIYTYYADGYSSKMCLGTDCTARIGESAYFTMDVHWYEAGGKHFYSVSAHLVGVNANQQLGEFRMLPFAYMTYAKHIVSGKEYPCVLLIGNTSLLNYSLDYATMMDVNILTEQGVLCRYHTDPFCGDNPSSARFDTPVYVDSLTFGDYLVDTFNIVYRCPNTSVRSVFSQPAKDVMYSQEDTFIHNRLIVNGTKYACSMYYPDRADCTLIVPEDSFKHLT